MKIKKPLPKTAAEWAAYRCRANCEIGRDALDGKHHPPPGVSRTEYALFVLLIAVESLSEQLTLQTQRDAGTQDGEKT